MDYLYTCIIQTTMIWGNLICCMERRKHQNGNQHIKLIWKSILCIKVTANQKQVKVLGFSLLLHVIRQRYSHGCFE